MLAELFVPHLYHGVGWRGDHEVDAGIWGFGRLLAVADDYGVPRRGHAVYSVGCAFNLFWCP